MWLCPRRSLLCSAKKKMPGKWCRKILWEIILDLHPHKFRIFFIFNLKYVYFHFKIWRIARERKDAIFHLLLHSPTCAPQLQLGQSRVSPKPEAENSIQVTCVAGREPSIWSLSCYLPGNTVAGSWNQNEKHGTNARSHYLLRTCIFFFFLLLL